MKEDFDLDANVESSTQGSAPAITSISLCTPGCLTSRWLCRPYPITSMCL